MVESAQINCEENRHQSLVLLCHKAGRPSVPHQGQRGRRAASRRAWPIRSELIERVLSDGESPHSALNAAFPDEALHSACGDPQSRPRQSV